ncbi:hypothetical protein [uncultured Planktomarina sp.]
MASVNKQLHICTPKQASDIDNVICDVWEVQYFETGQWKVFDC